MEGGSAYNGLSDRDLVSLYKICAYRKAGNPILSRLTEDSDADQFVATVREMWRNKAEQLRIEPRSFTPAEKDESNRRHQAMGEAWAAGGGREPDEVLKALSARKARRDADGH